MNTKILAAGRQTGKTTQLAKLAKEAGGIVVCSSMRQAQNVSRHHGAEAVSCTGIANMRGRKPQPLFIDDLEWVLGIMFGGVHNIAAATTLAEIVQPHAVTRLEWA